MFTKKRVAKRDEHAGERRFITRLTERGYLAFHVGQAVDGFPDIMAIKGDQVFLFEVKDITRRDDPISHVFEKSQPVFAQRLVRAKFTKAFVLFIDKDVDSCIMYQMGDMLYHVLMHDHLSIDQVALMYETGTSDSIIDCLDRLK